MKSIYFAVVICVFSFPLQGQTPPQLSSKQIADLLQVGDRLADQKDYTGALKSYTEAYVQTVSDIRGQPFQRPVKPSIFTREDLGKEMLEMLEKEYTEDELQLVQDTYRAWGFAPAELDVGNLIASLYTEEVAGFYDPDNKRMVLIVEDEPKEEPGWFSRLLGVTPVFDKDGQKTTLAHELTHALQDQLYDLNAMEEGIEKDDDQMLAFQALVEGDATLLMFVEMGDQDLEDMDPAAMRATFNLMSWLLPLSGGETFRRAPPIFKDSLTFPYFQGMLFVMAAAERKGWPAIHACYSAPPLSTEQILHPQKYLPGDQQDLPQQVTIPEVELDGWEKTGTNCLGEFQTRILLKSVRGGTQAANGWDGDSYQIFRSEDGGLGLVSVSIWDSANDAEEFADAYRKYRTSYKYAKDAFPAPAQQLVKVKDEQVWIVEGFTEETLRSIEEVLPQCEFSEKRFPLPGDRELIAR